MRPISGSPPGSPVPGRQEYWSGLPFPSPTHESEKWKWSCSVVSDSQRSYGLQPTRLLCPWDFPGRSTKVGCHCLLWVFSCRQCLFVHWFQMFDCGIVCVCFFDVILFKDSASWIFGFMVFPELGEFQPLFLQIYFLILCSFFFPFYTLIT